MKYLIFLYPHDKKWNKDIHNLQIAEELTTIVTSDEIKFVFGDNHTIFHFETNLSKSEIEIFLDLLLQETPTFMYVITENTKGIASNMDKTNLEDLLKINKRGRKPKANNKFKDIIPPLYNIDWATILEKQGGGFFKDLGNENICNLTIDEILEKIYDQGIDSLTKSEKLKLDEYSKNQ